MNNYLIEITLESDTTFGRGDGVAGWIDAEVEHDEFGLPYLRGRALKGLLAEECANILYSLKEFSPNYGDWKKAATELFGKGGSKSEDNSVMNVGNAVLPADLRQAVRFAIEDKDNNISAEDILHTLTTVRRQTAIEADGAPKKNSLRSARAILRQTIFAAEIDFRCEPEKELLQLLGAAAAGLQRTGLGRNRGRGKVSVKFAADDTNWLDEFEKTLDGETKNESTDI